MSVIEIDPNERAQIPWGDTATMLSASSLPSQWRWWFDTSTGERPELFFYTRELSIEPGDPLALRVNTSLDAFELEIWRDGAERTFVVRSERVEGVAQATNPAPYRNGCGWDVTHTIETEGWEPGGYVLVGRGEVDGFPIIHTHWVALRPRSLSRDRLTLVASTMTWQAYNSWGGSNHYEGIAGGTGDEFSPILSYDRPMQGGTAWLPVGAPRIPAPPPAPGTHTFYPAVDWALSHAYPKYFAAAGWATYERFLVAWLERQGYGVDLITQHDLHFRPELLDTSGPLLFTGHDEYWTRQMRVHLDAFTDRGGQVGRLGGNFMWQVRLSDDGLEQTCYKYDALTKDPYRSDPDKRHLLTFAWDKDILDYPAAKSWGVSGTRGVYASLGALAPRSAGGFTVYRPDHWVLEGTDAHYGDLLGAESRSANYEVDGLDYTMRHGLPHATDANGIEPDAVEIIALCPATNIEEDHGIEGSHFYVGDADAALVALTYYDEVTPEALAATKYGNGMLVEYRRGAGRVVSAGSVEWVNGLRLGDAQVEKVTANIVDRLLLDQPGPNIDER